MTPRSTANPWPKPAPELVAASLLTSDLGAEVHLISRDGRLLKISADEETARSVAISLWQALDRCS